MSLNSLTSQSICIVQEMATPVPDALGGFGVNTFNWFSCFSPITARIETASSQRIIEFARAGLKITHLVLTTQKGLRVGQRIVDQNLIPYLIHANNENHATGDIPYYTECYAEELEPLIFNNIPLNNALEGNNPSIPNAPTSLAVSPNTTTADSPSKQNISLAWTYPVNPTVFNIYYSINNGVTWQILQANISGTRRNTTGTVYDIRNNVDTLFAITAVTVGGESPKSTTVKILTAPLITSFNASSPTVIAVTSTATGSIYWQTSTDGVFYDPTLLTAANGNLTGLSANTFYFGEVQNVIAGFTSFCSDPSSTTTT